MNRLSNSDRVRIVACLVEGCSIRSTCRMTGAAKGTVLKLLADLGEVCEDFHDRAVRGLRTERLQCDEIWSFCGMKRKNVPAERKDDPTVGDVWTWTAIDADAKLMVSWNVGQRTVEDARYFMFDVADRIASDRVQLTSDGYRFYARVVREVFGNDVDYTELQKIFGAADGGPNARYSPPICIGCIKKHIIGNPDPAHVSTSYVERANLTMRMEMRRFTRLTNGFSKKLDNLRAAVALHFVHYNFCRKHQSIGTSPAVKAGIADHVWSIEELIGLLDAAEREKIGTVENKRGPYRQRVGNSK